MDLLLGGHVCGKSPWAHIRLTPNGETEAPSGENLCSWQNPGPESWLCFFHGASLPPVREWVLKRGGKSKLAACSLGCAEGSRAFPALGYGRVLSGVILVAGFRGQQPFPQPNGSSVFRAGAPIQVRPRWSGLFSAFRAQGLQLH